eukprot:4806324-Pleurochrysis_carterae.AAC.1
MEPRILNFVPASTMNGRAAAARKAARLVRVDDEANDDPTCAHQRSPKSSRTRAATKAMDAVVREMMNITDEMAAIDAKKVKAMRTSVG